MIDERKLIEDFEKEFKPHYNEFGDYEYLARMNLKGILSVISKQPKVGKWIPCSERLPETNENKKYIVCGKNGGIYIAEFVCKAISNGTSIGPWWSAHGRYCPNPIAWMPLPEPYKGE